MAFQFNNNDNWQDKVSQSVLFHIQQKGESDFFVIFHQEADLEKAHSLRGKNLKAEFVFSQLKRIAQNSQTKARAILRQHQKAFHPYYLLNAIYTSGNIDLIEALAKLPEVKAIYANPAVKIQQPAPRRGQLSSRDMVDWGIDKINADDLWAMNIRGENIVVGGADTGVKWNIPAIEQQYRGNDNGVIDHNYNWHDAIHSISPLHNDSIISPTNNPCGLNSMVPCDDNNHGTHTIGTMVGGDNGEVRIGVAPAAKWIACRNMERGWGSPASYIECFEWFLAPTDLNGENPDPAKSPHIINNSWSCLEVEGCNSNNWWMIETAVNNLKAAGIVVVVSAGNAGSECNTINTPAAIFEGSFTVGAMSDVDTIPDFSSRGVILADSSMRMKPNVVAPGVDVLSCLPDSSFAAWSGTSMAGPHVSGAVALLLSAYPSLIGEVDLVEEILEKTAVPIFEEMTCDGYTSDDIPNPVSGYGRIDILAAFEYAQTITTQLNNLDINKDLIGLYPNPISNTLYFQTHKLREEAQWLIFATDGKLVKSGMLIPQQTQVVNTKELPSGLYFYQIKGKNIQQSGKLIKQ